MPGLTTTHLSLRNAFPRTVPTDLRASTRAEVIVRWSGSAGTPGTVTIKQLADSLPGGSAVWDEIQFSRFDIYGAQLKELETVSTSDWPSITVKFDNTINSNYLGDVPTFYSDAVGNSRRAHVGFTPNHLFRQAWFPTSREDAILTLVTDQNQATAPQFAALVQFTVAVRSVAGNVASESVPSVVRSAAGVRHV